MWTWVLELECAKMDEQRRKKAWKGRGILIPLYGRTKTMRPHRPGKTRLSPKRHHQWRGWVTTSVLMRIPE